MVDILFVGDCHVGGLDAICPPQVVIEQTDHRRFGRKDKEKVATYNANSDQLWLYNCWKTMVQEVGTVDLMVLNGDMCDGINRKSGGVGMWNTNIRVQAGAMIELAKMVHAKRVAGTLGSYYHVSNNMSSDEYVVDALGGVFRTELRFTADELRFNVSHEIGGSFAAWHTRYTALGRELQAAYLNTNTYRKYDAIVRSHVHYFTQAEMTDGDRIKTAFTTPCWKLRDDYAKKRSMTLAPHIGYVLVRVRGDKMVIRPRMFTRQEFDDDDFSI